MATSSADKTVFFFKINVIEGSGGVSRPGSEGAGVVDGGSVVFRRATVEVVPIGFFQVDEAPVIQVAISPDNHSNNIEPKIEDEDEEDEDSNDNDDENENEGEDEDEAVVAAREEAARRERSGEVRDEDGKRVLLTLKNGAMMTLIVPPVTAVNTDVSFQVNHAKSIKWFQ